MPIFPYGWGQNASAITLKYSNFINPISGFSSWDESQNTPYQGTDMINISTNGPTITSKPLFGNKGALEIIPSATQYPQRCGVGISVAGILSIACHNEIYSSGSQWFPGNFIKINNQTKNTVGEIILPSNYTMIENMISSSGSILNYVYANTLSVTLEITNI